MAESIFKNYRPPVEKKEEKPEVKDEIIATPNIITRYLEKGQSDGEPVIEPEHTPLDATTTTSNRLPKELTAKKVLASALSDGEKDRVKAKLESQSGIFDKLKKKEETPKDTSGLANVEYEEHDPRFMKQFPRHELYAKDHSGIIVAKVCLRKYFYREVINLVPTENSVIFLPWGTAYHIYRERLSELYGYGESEPKTYDEEKAKEAHKQAAREATKYWHEHGEDQKPGTKWDWFTTERFYASCAKAFEHWVNEKKLGKVKVLSIEQYFNIQIKDGRFVQGRTDEVVEVREELWGRDFKSTSKPQEWFKNQLSPNNQVRTYSFGTARLSNRPVRGMLIQALYNGKSTKKGPKGPDVYEEIIEVTDYEIEMWEEEQVQWNNILELCREKDVWPQNEMQCAWCEYNIVCRKGTEAAMVFKLENAFQQRLRDPSRMGAEE
jgi:hypothetical protein